MEQKLMFEYYCDKCGNEWVGSLFHVDCCECGATGYIVYDRVKGPTRLTMKIIDKLTASVPS